jgi:hypothetical protein
MTKIEKTIKALGDIPGVAVKIEFPILGFEAFNEAQTVCDDLAKYGYAFTVFADVKDWYSKRGFGVRPWGVGYRISVKRGGEYK